MHLNIAKSVTMCMRALLMIHIDVCAYILCQILATTLQLLQQRHPILPLSLQMPLQLQYHLLRQEVRT